MNPPTSSQLSTAFSIIPHESAPSGSVLHLDRYRPSDFPRGSAILCRNVAPIVSFAYALLKRDVSCIIRGRDIGATLISIVNKMHAPDLETLQAKLSDWSRREIARATDEGNDHLVERILDQRSCIVFFIQSLDESSRTVRDLIAKIELMFTDSEDTSSKVLLSTIHKAKGLEWNVVFLLDRHRIPSKYARTPSALIQERNLLYVAITRSKDTLIYINSDAWQQSS